VRECSTWNICGVGLGAGDWPGWNCEICPTCVFIVKLVISTCVPCGTYLEVAQTFHVEHLEAGSAQMFHVEHCTYTGIMTCGVVPCVVNELWELHSIHSMYVSVRT